MGNNREVWVYIQRGKPDIREASLEILGKACELAEQLRATVAGVFLGTAPPAVLEKAFAFGAQKAYVLQSPCLDTYTSSPYAQAITWLVKQKKPDIFLLAATRQGRDLAPRVASALGAGLTADCTDLQIGPYRDPKTNTAYRNILYQIRPAWGGNVIATIVSPLTRPQMATVREGVMKLPEPRGACRGEVVELDADLERESVQTRILESRHHEKAVDLKAAKIIVAGGAGMGSKENFLLIRQCAEVLGGEVGVTRAGVDAGFASEEYQIGQTGTTVRPKLYIACGISGAVQHVAGMDQSGKIIAINTDPEAPIFTIAHYGIIGDAAAVLPILINAYKHLGR